MYRIREYLWQVLIGVGVVATVTALAVLNKYWTWPNAIVGGVLLLCGVLYLMDRFGIGPSLRSRVRDWLDDSGFAIKKVDDANIFHYRVTDAIGMVTDVLQLKSNSPILIATGHHKASGAQLVGYNALTPEKQQAFWKGVRAELLRYGVSFSDLKLDGGGVLFSDQVVPDSTLNGTEFLRRLLFVRSGGRLYWELLLILDPPSHPIPASSPASAPAPPSGNQQAN